MTTPNKDNNAFPMFTSGGECIHESAAGLTKREFFAIKAMQGYLAHPNGPQGSTLIQQSVLMADMLLEELEKGGGDEEGS